MNQQHRKKLEALACKGWDVRFQSSPMVFPDGVRLRFDWIPDEVRQFVEGTDAVVSPDEKAWFVTSTDLSGESGAAFSCDQWELDSLQAAGDDLRLQQQIRAWWDRHFVVMMSVKSGYSFFAIRQQDLVIVSGEEPEYEETIQIATSFSDFLKRVCSGDSRLSRWIMLDE